MDLGVLKTLIFHGFFSALIGGGSAPMKFKAFHLPPSTGGRTSIITLTFRLHCAEDAVRSASSVASEAPSPNQDAQDFL